MNTAGLFAGRRPVTMTTKVTDGARQQARPVAKASAAAGRTMAPSIKIPTLQNPARLGGTSVATVPVTDIGGDLSLDVFMHLPTEQYSALDPKMILPLGGNKFRLAVPRISIFNAWVQPTVDVAVTMVSGPQPRVVLVAEACHIDGSDFVQRMHLNKRFTLHFVTELTWAPALAPGGQGSITGDLEVEVLTEVVSPFDLLPRDVLEGTCNGVLRGLIRSLLPLFMKKLGQDYELWSSDPTYRSRRAALSLSKPLNSD